MSAIAYIFDIFNKCGDNYTPVATFEATLLITLDTAELFDATKEIRF